MLLSSAGGLIALLDENNPKLKSLALTKLDQVVDSMWPEIADVVTKIETLYEDPTFASRNQAALLASKVYYHLGSYEDALTFALAADNLFNVNAHTEYTDTIIAKCIDYYTKLRSHNEECKDPKDKKPMNPQLEAIVNRMFERCFSHQQYKQAIGIAIESRRLDMFERAIKESNDMHGILSYSVKTVLTLIQNRKYRNEILRKLVELYAHLPMPDYINMCQCLIFLEDPTSIADILEKLVIDTETKTLLAYQIAFDLYESATQQFICDIMNVLRQNAPVRIPTKVIPKPDEAAASTSTDKTTESGVGTGEKMEVDESTDKAKEKTEPAVVSKSRTDLSGDELERQLRFERLVEILDGEQTIHLHMQFLIKNNKTDMLILKNIKDAVRNSVCHTATVIANGFMHAGTTCDDFLRDNIEWVGKATNWAKFTAVGSLGVMHKGHEKEALRVLDTYLPKSSAAQSSGYMEGGGLYALGLIFANHGAEKIDYLKEQLQAATAEPVRHGGCLGLGLAGMGTGRQDLYEVLRHQLYQDDAVTGEAAGIAIGLVMIGSRNPTAVQDMLAYAQDTQHEKILRGLCIGIALTMYARLEEADSLVESLLRDKDPNLRRSGVYTLAMAYVGTSNNQAVRKLLHIAVSDVNDDVRRSAVIAIGFLMFRTPDQVPTMVSLLSESYNAHVRYGAAIALGVACAGTGQKDAIALLEPLLNDPAAYVRQGCLISYALILMQHNEHTAPKVKEFRTSLTKIITDKHEDLMVKFGAIFAQGILDAGGRNVSVSLQSRHGHTDMESVVAMLIFLQHWYWFPFSHFLSLAFKPTCLIGLNKELKMPKLDFLSNAKPSLYAPAPPLEEKKEKQNEKVEAAILSVTAKAKRKEEKKKEDKAGKTDEKMDTEDSVRSGSDAAAHISTEKRSTSEVDEKKSDVAVAEDNKLKKTESGEKEKVKEEPAFQLLPNPARVMKAQLKIVSVPHDSRFEPLKNVGYGGIIMMNDRKPDDNLELVELSRGGGVDREDDSSEPDAPEPFKFDESLL